MSDGADVARGMEAARCVHLDAAVIALHLVGEPSRVGATRALFEALSEGSVRAQTSAISLYQILAEPYRRGQDKVAAEVAKRLGAYPGLRVLPVTAAIAVQAAQVRASLGGRSERALQVSTALAGGADVYLTTGSGLRRIAGMRVADVLEFVGGEIRNG